MTESISLAAQAQLQTRFGIAFEEFNPHRSPDDHRCYSIIIDRQGYLLLDEIVNRFGERPITQKVFVEYVDLRKEKRGVARRESHFDRTKTSVIGYADIAYIQGDVKKTYQISPIDGAISLHVQDIADPTLPPFDLLKAFYVNGVNALSKNDSLCSNNSFCATSRFCTDTAEASARFVAACGSLA